METTPFDLVLVPPVPNLYRTRPDPYLTRIGIFFFWGAKMGTLGVRMQQYPGSIRTHEVPGTGTTPILPYPCFLVTRPSRDKKMPWDSNPIQPRVEAPQPVTFKETLQKIDNEIGFIQK